MNWRMKSATAGPGPGDPPLPHQEAALALARQQRLAVVELEDELDLLAQRLDRVEQAKAGAAHPGRDRGAPEDPGEHAGRRLGDLLGDPERQRDPGVDRAAEGDHRVDPLAAAVGGRLVTEHPALRVAAEVDVAPGRLAHPVDGLGDGDTWSARLRSSPPSSCSGEPKSTTQGSAPCSCRTATALEAGETS